MKPGIKKRVRLLITSNQQKGKKKQNGIALLVLVIAIALTLSTYYFSSISVVDIKIDNLEKTRVALKQAKQALINYAITHVDGNGSGVAGEYGYLPCPDSSAASTEGNQDPSCGVFFKNRLGYLPWKSLDLPVLKDGAGSCLWYAVSGSYKGENIEEPLKNYFKHNTGLINEDTNGLFQVVGGADGIVAVIFAPGAPLAGQARVVDVNTQCGENYGNQIAYLEGDGVTDNSNVPDVVDSPDQFIHATLTSDAEATPYNDSFVTISQEEIWQAIMRRSDLNERLHDITEALTMCLAQYANNNTNKRFPWPALMNLDGDDYRMMDSYQDKLGAPQNYAGRFPFYLDDSNVALGLAASNIVDMGFCSNLIVTSGVTVDLETAGSEHRILLNNWKDHFFYAVSKDYALPNDVWEGCGDCVSVDGADYSAIVFFSGSPYADLTQLRDNGDKPDATNYLENDNAGLFPDMSGFALYKSTNTDPDISNDIVFCAESTANSTDAINIIDC